MFNRKKNSTGTECDAIVREIAERCASAAVSQMSDAAQHMNVAQLRGYVRAHAWPQIWAEAQDAVAKGPLTLSQSNDVAGRALEHTVHLVTLAYSGAPIVAMPGPSSRSRGQIPSTWSVCISRPAAARPRLARAR